MKCECSDIRAAGFLSCFKKVFVFFIIASGKAAVLYREVCETDHRLLEKDRACGVNATGQQAGCHVQDIVL